MGAAGQDLLGPLQLAGPEGQGHLLRAVSGGTASPAANLALSPRQQRGHDGYAPTAPGGATGPKDPADLGRSPLSSVGPGAARSRSAGDRGAATACLQSRLHAGGGAVAVAAAGGDLSSLSSVSPGVDGAGQRVRRQSSPRSRGHRSEAARPDSSGPRGRKPTFLEAGLV